MNKGTALFIGIVLAGILAYLVLPSSFAQTEQKIFYVTLDPRLQTGNDGTGVTSESPMSVQALQQSLKQLQQQFRIDNRQTNLPSGFRLPPAGPEGYATLPQVQTPIRIVIVPNTKSSLAEVIPLPISREVFSNLEISGLKDKSNRKPRLQLTGTVITQRLKINDVYMHRNSSYPQTVDVISFDRNQPFRADLDGVDIDRAISFLPQYYLTGGGTGTEPYVANNASISVANSSLIANGVLQFGLPGGDSLLENGYDPQTVPEQIIDLGSITMQNVAMVQTKTSNQPVRIYNSILRVGGSDARQLRVGRWRANLSRITLLRDATQADQPTDSFVDTSGNQADKAPPAIEIRDAVSTQTLSEPDLAKLAQTPPTYTPDTQGPTQGGWVWQTSQASGELDAENRLRDAQIRKNQLQGVITGLAAISGLVLGVLFGLHFGLAGALLGGLLGAGLFGGLALF